jgi:hypothetical protein
VRPRRALVDVDAVARDRLADDPTRWKPNIE